MSANTTPIYPLVFQMPVVTFANADGTTAKTFFTAGTNSSRIDSISVTSTAGADVAFQLIVNDGAADHLVGTFNVATNVGTTISLKAVQVLSSSNFPWLDASGSIFLASGKILKFKAVSAVPTGLVDFVGFAGDY